MKRKFELTIDDIKDIFRAGVDRGMNDQSSYDWGCSPSSSYDVDFAYAMKEVLNKDKKWDDQDFVTTPTIFDWMNET